MSNISTLWVFGYGSLCWHPGFEYGDQAKGHITGFARKFWQGNTEHRGTKDKPGRVATLVQEQNAITHGMAFQLKGEKALQYLEQRECKLGGYISLVTMFHPRDCDRESFPVLLYIATESNEHWMGPAQDHDIAEQVVNCSGRAGHNVEYVLRLAEWIRKEIPETQDAHLFQIESHIRLKITERKLCLQALMGEKKANILEAESESNATTSGASGDSFAFSKCVCRNKLRCLKL
ncbi:putative glutathione-specific gamma-glutamylcyclotransferase 2 [Tigriopus californicus]|uniref:putative glutathione-specific gamma-glutamylcyclotransferase 2 n=1 Tax=Tigriopus californicus TaxID=6832 RepID=UPI0027DA73FE|nr:putative glutathione-specific gamma-glutamylcyclotransferase 2 [Tigriopus californicus]